jgi:catechol 2,3-dioxygenase
MKIQNLGHAVINVRSQERAEAFYAGVLGMGVAARTGGMTFFTVGNHHDLAVRAVGDDAAEPDPGHGVGLFHLAFKVGDSLDELRAWKTRLEAHGVPIDHVADHTVTCALYFKDPDGNGLELYVDTSDVWKTDPATVSTMKRMEL